MRVVLLGAPGAGKGTQARILATRYGVPHVSTGDLFRDHLSRGTPLGQEARQYMDQGLLVPDAVTEAMVAERLDGEDAARGFVLDGFPRTVGQAEALADLGRARGFTLTAVVHLVVPVGRLVSRLSGRRVCPKCGASYHVELDPPEVPGVCDRCGGALTQRADDTAETVATRLRVYHEQTAPLIAFYEAAGLLRAVDGDQSVEAVTAAIISALGVSP